MSEETTTGGPAGEEFETSLDLPAGMFRSGENPDTIDIPRLTKFGMQNRPVTYTEVEGMAVVEGDIVLGTAHEVRTAPDSLGLVRVGEQFRWPNGVVPYVVEPSLEARVAAAIAHWQARTPIRFVRRTPANAAQFPDYISFEPLNGCWSYVGRQGGEQQLSLGPGCPLGSAIHEIGHALGLWHEQGRHDRDEHVTILIDRVRPNARHNFDKQVNDGLDVGPYDFGSIMHYPRTAFSIDGRETIIPKHGESIGQRNGLSAGDVAAIRSIYPNLDWSGFGG